MFESLCVAWMNIRKRITHLPRAYDSTVSGVTTESSVGAVSFKSKSLSISSSSPLLHTSVFSSNSEDSAYHVLHYDQKKLNMITYLFLALRKLVNSVKYLKHSLVLQAEDQVTQVCREQNHHHFNHNPYVHRRLM